MQVTGQDPGQEVVLLLPAAVRHQGRTDRLQRDSRQRYIGQCCLVHEDLLLKLAKTAAAVLRRPAEAEPAVPAHPADHLAVHAAVPLSEHLLPLGWRDKRREVCPHFISQRALGAVEFKEHQASAASDASLAVRVSQLASRSSRAPAPPTRAARSVINAEYRASG